MPEVDRELGDRRVPALWRPIVCWMEMSGERVFRSARPDPNRDPFEGHNLYHQIKGWYGRHYPLQATFQGDWGVRWFMICGEFYRARMPIIFNPTNALDAFEYLEDLPPALAGLLCNVDMWRLQLAFNGFFRQASDINLCLCSARGRANPAFALLERSWSDLRTSGIAFQVGDPTAVLFPIQQAAEKSLKALLISQSVVRDQEEARQRYGHKFCRLMATCSTVTAALDFLQPHVHLLSFDPSVRYERVQMGPHDVVNRMNYAYAVCAAVAKSLLRFDRKRNTA